MELSPGEGASLLKTGLRRSSVTATGVSILSEDRQVSRVGVKQGDTGSMME